MWSDEEEDIEKVVATYYEKLFTSSSPSEEAINVVVDVVAPTIIASMNAEFCRKCSKKCGRLFQNAPK